MDDNRNFTDSAIPAIWCAYKLAPSLPFFPMFNISEAKHGQNAVTIQSIEKGRFETDGEVSPRIDLKRPETFVPIEISIPWKYRLRIQMADNSVNTVYTNDMEAEWLLYLMSSQKAIDRYRSMAFSGKWDAALLEVQQMCNSFVNSATNVSATDSLGNLAGYRAEPKS